MDFETILLKKEEHMATITLNRPQAMNAITRKMLEELNIALADIDKDNDVRVMILTGAGRAFCAAADLKAGGEKAEPGKRFMWDLSLEEMRQLIRRGPQQITLGIRSLEKPTIAMVNGLAIGDGFDWCLACDIRIGCENTRFMNAYIRMGVTPGTGMTWFTPRIMGYGRAAELLFTGEWLEAEEAYRTGVLNKLVPSAQLEKVTMELAHKIANRSPIALRLTKYQLHRGLSMSLEDALLLACDGELLAVETKDHVEAVAAYLEKREPQFKGK